MKRHQLDRTALRASRRGVALILVLAFIAILSGLILAFFFTTGNSRREAAQFEAGVTVNQLAETATNVVMGQITDGTRSWDVPPPAFSTAAGQTRLTYVTQPGLVRSYTDRGVPLRVFKLYSSGSMVVDLNNEGTSTKNDWIVTQRLKDEVPLNWASLPAKYVDMNAPVLTPDPNGEITLPGTTQKYTANYPILDPSGLSKTGRRSIDSTPQDGIDGFDLVDVPGYGGAVDGKKRPAIDQTQNPQRNIPGKTANPAPMPVQWLYVLQNGTITAPRAVVDNVADWNNLPDGSANKPSKSNPIVGRLAFWTDDDGNKLNPNVHSEGVAWDRALSGGSFPGSPYGEQQLRDSQPAMDEFPRYAGHPASVSLSPLLGVVPSFRVPYSDMLNATDFFTRYLPYYNLVPRIGQGGSMGGTAITYDKNIAVSPITLDGDRLFASNDEMIFTPNRTATSVNIKRRDMEKMKFFLTPNARSPETTLFNQPRVGLWMIQQSPDPNASKNMGPARPRNAKDDLLAHCTTVGGYPFHFQRHSIYLRTPVNNRLTHPTIPVMQIPEHGFVQPSSQHTTLDWQMKRNQELYAYLQKMTEMPVPGFGGTMLSLYPAAQRDQILTQMVDLLRLTNSYAINAQLPPRYEFAPARQMPDAVSGETQVVPLVPRTGTGAGTKGIGRFPTITEAMMVFHNVSTPPNQAPPAGQPDPRRMRVLLAFEPFTPNAGSWTWSPLVRYVVRGLENVSINGQRGYFSGNPKYNTNLVTSRCGYGSGGNHNTAHTGTFANFRYWAGSGTDRTKTIPPSIPPPAVPPPDPPASYEETMYPFVSYEIPYDARANNGKFTFAVDGEIVVEIHSGYAAKADSDSLVQTVRLQFPAMVLPVPRDAGADRNFQNRIDTNKFNLVNGADTVRSVEVDPKGPSKGDLRIVAAMKDVPATFFAPYAGGVDGPGFASDTPIIHSFRNGDGGTVTGGKIQSALIPGRRDNYIAARGMEAAQMNGNLPGDWDNGPYGFKDGAYINKPDDYYGSNQGDWYESQTNTPNRQVSSGVVFGSLPVNIHPQNPEPWRTLLFCPNPAAGLNHPARKDTGRKVRDHLFLDFFTMPVVEPYAISEPLSTIGKVNLNYQLAPFSYITRATALHGVLKSTRIMAVPTSGPSGLLRKAINPEETLKGFEERFNDPARGMFRSASEICEMFLVPALTVPAAPGSGVKLTDMKTWWDGYKLTGDNAREQPYGQIYARTAVRSNTFTIHMRVQTLRKKPGSANDYEVWREGVDAVTGEYRGSSTIERYVDFGGSQAMPDFATNPNATLDSYYKFRVVQTKRFNP